MQFYATENIAQLSMQYYDHDYDNTSLISPELNEAAVKIGSCLLMPVASLIQICAIYYKLLQLGASYWEYWHAEKSCDISIIQGMNRNSIYIWK